MAQSYNKQKSLHKCLFYIVMRITLLTHNLSQFPVTAQKCSQRTYLDPNWFSSFRTSCVVLSVLCPQHHRTYALKKRVRANKTKSKYPILIYALSSIWARKFSMYSYSYLIPALTKIWNNSLTENSDILNLAFILNENKSNISWHMKNDWEKHIIFKT